MNQPIIGTEGPLTQEEKDTLRTQRNSEIFRICRKAISYEYAVNGAMFGSRRFGENEIYIAQGKQQGLLAAYNIILSGTIDK